MKARYWTIQVHCSQQSWFGIEVWANDGRDKGAASDLSNGIITCGLRKI
jgi:hypothetical protein